MIQSIRTDRPVKLHCSFRMIISIFFGCLNLSDFYGNLEYLSADHQKTLSLWPWHPCSFLTKSMAMKHPLVALKLASYQLDWESHVPMCIMYSEITLFRYQVCDISDLFIEADILKSLLCDCPTLLILSTINAAHYVSEHISNWFKALRADDFFMMSSLILS